jgi:hypothetical protein
MFAGWPYHELIRTHTQSGWLSASAVGTVARPGRRWHRPHSDAMAPRLCQVRLIRG